MKIKPTLILLILLSRNIKANHVLPKSPGLFETELFSICKLRLIEHNQDRLKFTIDRRNNGAHCSGTGKNWIFHRIPGEKSSFIQAQKKYSKLEDKNKPACLMIIDFESPTKFALTPQSCKKDKSLSKRIYFSRVNS